MKDYPDTRLEEESKTKARIATTITAILVIISLFVITFTVDAKMDKEDEEGILVNFGTTDFGSGPVQPQQKNEQPITEPVNIPEVKSPSVTQKAAPKKSTPTPVKKQSNLTQKEESAVVDKTTKKTESKPQKTPEKEVTKNSTKPDTGDAKQTSTSNQKAQEPAKPSVNQRAIYPGNKNVNSGGEGPDSQAGDKGQRDGSPAPGAYEGTNSGLGKSGVNYSLSGRKLVQAPSVQDNSNIEGKITISIKVDQNGKVIAASLGRPTTISDNTLVQKAIEAAKKAKFDQNKSASEEQFGTITFVFKVR